jgi:hypothetical protein
VVGPRIAPLVPAFERLMSWLRREPVPLESHSPETRRTQDQSPNQRLTARAIVDACVELADRATRLLRVRPRPAATSSTHVMDGQPLTVETAMLVKRRACAHSLERCGTAVRHGGRQSYSPGP